MLLSVLWKCLFHLFISYKIIFGTLHSRGEHNHGEKDGNRVYLRKVVVNMVIFSSASFVPQKDDNFSDQSVFLLQLYRISEIAEGMKRDRQDDFQTNEENKPSADITFARDFDRMQDKLN